MVEIFSKRDLWSSQTFGYEIIIKQVKFYRFHGPKFYRFQGQSNKR